jgi:RHS repeat-associated protein
VFIIDALGRHRAQTIGSGTTTTYGYLGTSNTVSSTVAGTTLQGYSGIDAIGDRLTSGVSGGYGYLVPDLHGNVVAIATSAGAWTTAYRYDPYGETVDVCDGSITSLWRFQGRILESAPGSTDLYDFSARSYDPSLGAFTSFDSVSGSAQNPLTLNRYLYANANPATLVDPDGHMAAKLNDSSWEAKAIAKKDSTSASTATKPCAGHDVDIKKCWGSNTADPDDFEVYFPSAPTAPAIADDPVAQAMIDAYGQVSGSGGAMACSGIKGAAGDNCWNHLIIDELRIMCADADDDPSNAACFAVSKLTPSFLAQLPEAMNLANTLVLAAGVTTLALGCVAATGGVCLALLEGAALGGASSGATYVGFCATGVTSDCSPGGFVDATVQGGAYGVLSVAGATSRLRLPEAGCSFTPDTPVATTSGFVAIASLRVGDQVMAYDPKTGETTPHIVTAVMVHEDPATEHLVTDAGPIETTPNHPFFTTDRGWIEAGQLAIGEQIRTESGAPATVLSFTIDDHPARMWDLTVDEAHSFFVGSGQVLVHNCPISGGGTGRPVPPNTPGTQMPGARPDVFTKVPSAEALQVGQLAREVGDIGKIGGGPSVIAPAGASGKAGLLWKVLRALGIFFGGNG